jgi:hypothetical protein
LVNVSKKDIEILLEQVIPLHKDAVEGNEKAVQDCISCWDGCKLTIRATRLRMHTMASPCCYSLGIRQNRWKNRGGRKQD